MNTYPASRLPIPGQGTPAACVAGRKDRWHSHRREACLASLPRGALEPGGGKRQPRPDHHEEV